MIKPFKMTDLGAFLPNEWSNPDEVLDALRDASYSNYTVWDGDMVAAIICFKPYWQDCYLGFFLISEDLKPRVAVILKRWVRDRMEKLGAKRLQTDSVDCETLNKWHEWLGFTWEGKRSKMMYGQDYNMWAILRGM